MIVELEKDLPPEAKTDLILKLKANRCDSRELPPVSGERIGILGKPGCSEEEIRRLPGVSRVLRVKTPFKLVGREMHPQDTCVRVGDVVIGGENISVIAGPCAVESLEQALTIAREVKRAGAALFRGGAFKPRTSPYAFQGLGQAGLELLAAARQEFGLGIVTEAIDHENFDAVEAVVDVVQIGARNMQNFSLLRRAGRSRKPVLLKRGLSATIEELLM
ncbi:MAG: hypothetical protein Q7U75_13715, partial [Desulfobacterales bacterium]|nr:hypothetical protein [Desulfobacterales bacterium]